MLLCFTGDQSINLTVGVGWTVNVVLYVIVYFQSLLMSRFLPMVAVLFLNLTGSEGTERLHAARQPACEGTAEAHAKFKGVFFCHFS